MIRLLGSPGALPTFSVCQTLPLLGYPFVMKNRAPLAEIAGLQRKLTRNLAPEKSEELHMQWQVADCLGRFYRPNFETMLYPYCPTHIERPKEVKKVFLLNLPERAFLTVRLSLQRFGYSYRGTATVRPTRHEQCSHRCPCTAQEVITAGKTAVCRCRAA